MAKRVNSKAKGRLGEQKWSRQLNDWGIEARRGVQYQGGPDSPDVVTPSLNIHWEVKYGYPWEKMNPGSKALGDAWEQAYREVPHRRGEVMARRPVVAWKPKGTRVWLLTWLHNDRLVTAVATKELILELGR
ncbi:MAG: hypothetical protein B7733_12970 [Myxococcales bacterium FL481]|nr:MAG: hypothetical protein B7733_12970 [Myxococcales bacterium FL481]